MSLVVLKDLVTGEGFGDEPPSGTPALVRILQPPATLIYLTGFELRRS
jgi:hypothetical protein